MEREVMYMHSRRRRPSRSRSRRNRSVRKEKLTFTPVIVILCLSVGCGYAAAKYVVDPVVNYVPQIMAEKEQNTEKNETQADESQNSDNTTNVLEDQVSVEETGKVSGYALQFGCYSSKTAADAVMPTVGVEGLQVIEQNDMYKIVGEIYKTKDEAKTALNELPDTVNGFVTTIYE